MQTFSVSDVKRHAFMAVAKPAAILIVAWAVVATPVRNASAKSLDDAVKQQLQVTNGRRCEMLLGTDLLISGVLSDPLGAICALGGGSGGAVSTASGGGAATADTLPGIVQKRLREASQKQQRLRLASQNQRGSSTAPAAFTNAFQQDTAGVAPFGAPGADSAEWAVTSFDNGRQSNSWVFQKDDSGLSFYIAPEYTSLKREITLLGDGYDSDAWRLTAGADYQFSERALAGIALDYASQNGGFAGGGRFDKHSYGAQIYWVFSPVEKLNLQVTAGYSRVDSNRERPVLLTATASTPSGPVERILAQGTTLGSYGSNEYQASILADYEIDIDDQFTVSPRAGLNWQRSEFGAYRETGGTGLELQFDGGNETFLLTRGGVQASMLVETDFGLVAPQLSIDWLHDLANSSTVRTVSFVDDIRVPPKRFAYEIDRNDKDYFEFNAGFGIELSNGIQASASYRTLFGNSHFTEHTAAIGLRAAF